MFSNRQPPARGECLRSCLGDELSNNLGARLLEVLGQTLQLLPRRLVKPQHETLAVRRESWERPPGIPPLEASPARQLAGKSTAVISRSMWRNQGAVYPHFAVCLKSDVMPSFPEAAFRQLHIYKSSISRDA